MSQCIIRGNQVTNTLPESIDNTYMTRRLQRAFFSICIVLGAAACLLASLTNPPYYGTEPGVLAAIRTNALDGDLMDVTHLWSEVVGAYLMPLAILALAWLANSKSPRLASVGALISLIGYLPLSLFTGQDALYYDIARWGSNPFFTNLAQRWNADPIMNFYGIAFGLGTVVGTTLIGLALWRTRAVPIWAAVCITFSRLPVFVFPLVSFHVIAAIVLIGMALLFLGSIGAGLALLKVPA